MAITEKLADTKPLTQAEAVAAHDETLAEIEAALGCMADALLRLGSGFRSVIAEDAYLCRAINAHRERQEAQYQLVVARQRQERQAVQEARKARI
jgi:hypothetical protein